MRLQLSESVKLSGVFLKPSHQTHYVIGLSVHPSVCPYIPTRKCCLWKQRENLTFGEHCKF